MAIVTFDDVLEVIRKHNMVLVDREKEIVHGFCDDVYFVEPMSESLKQWYRDATTQPNKRVSSSG